MQTVFTVSDDPNQSTGLSDAPKRRRKRDTVVCAECRRLKLKCDRTWPCSSCTRRGCAAICPTGSLAPGMGGRLLVSNIGVLRERISTLSERVQSLEDALEKVAGPNHPLLKAELRALVVISTDLSSQNDEPEVSGRRSDQSNLQAPPVHTPDFDDHTRSDMQEKQSGPTGAPRDGGPLNELLELGRTFPQPLDEEDMIDASRAVQDIKSMLPPLDEGRELVHAFYKTFGATFQPVPKCRTLQILDEVYLLAAGRTDLDGVHKLALIFITLALAQFQHIHSSGEDSYIPETYFYLSKSLFCIRSFMESTNAVTVHGLLLSAMYCELTNRSSATWTILGIAGKIALGNNLHHDPTRWAVDAHTSNTRRWLFWELYSFDVLYTLTVQRAPTYSMAYVDSPFPDLPLDSHNEEERILAHFLSKYRFTSEILPKLMETAFGRNTATYAMIIEIDRMVRTSWLPECLEPNRQDHPSSLPESRLHSVSVQRFTTLFYRELALMLLHRPLLAIALTESSGDPLQHRFAQSVLACYRSAHKLAASLRSLVADPKSNGHHVCFWRPGFSATTVLASVALLSPDSPWGSAARQETLSLCEIFVSSNIPIPSSVIHWLQRLKQKLLHPNVETFSNRDSEVQNAPDWNRFGADDYLISTRALVNRVRKEIPTNYHGGTPSIPSVPSIVDDDPFALLIRREDSSALNEPIAPEYFPPVEQPANLFPESIFSTLGIDGFVDDRVVAGSLHDIDASSQWERFLRSIGVPES